MTVFNQSCGGTLGLSGGVTKQANKKVAGLLGLLGGIQSGTAQAGASKSITLAPGALEIPDAYAGTIEITGEPGAGQVRNVVGSRKNLLAYSQDFTKASWNKRGTLVITPNSVIAPDGSLTGSSVTGIDTVAIGDIWQFAQPSGESWERREPFCYIWPISTSGILRINNPIHTFGGEWRIDLSLLSAGWNEITRNNPAVTVIFEFVNYLGSNSGFHINKFSGSGPLSINLWGVQLIPGTGISSEYIHTEANPAVGAIIDIPWSIIPDATSPYILRDGKNFRLIGKAVGGALSFSGGVAKLTSRLVGGALSFAGAVFKQISKPVGGALSFSGGVARQVNKLVGGVLSFSGGLGRVFSNTVAKIAMLFKKRGMTFTFSQRKATFTASKRSATFRKVP